MMITDDDDQLLIMMHEYICDYIHMIDMNYYNYLYNEFHDFDCDFGCYL